MNGLVELSVLGLRSRVISCGPPAPAVTVRPVVKVRGRWALRLRHRRSLGLARRNRRCRLAAHFLPTSYAARLEIDPAKPIFAGLVSNRRQRHR